MAWHRQRVSAAQKLMREQGMAGIMVMNDDDFRYFFGELRVQPRAIIPFDGAPTLITFAHEVEHVAAHFAGCEVVSFADVGEQMQVVKKIFAALVGQAEAAGLKQGEQIKIGMQMWFRTPAFLVDMFRKINRQAKLVPSDSVLDPLRQFKDEDEFALLRQAQEIAAQGMDCARALLRPGISGQELAAEITYTMMKAGAEGTSTPIYINNGPRSAAIHGMVTKDPIQAGELVVIDLTPQYQGYCANLARSFIIGEPSAAQRSLFETYLEMHEATRQALKPGIKPFELDRVGKAVCEKNGLGAAHTAGISHGIGLRFEEKPAPTIVVAHRITPFAAGMCVTVGHTILAQPQVGGVRFEDVCRLREDGVELLHPYPYDWQL